MHLLNIFRNSYAFHHGHSHVECLPQISMVEPTNDCNLNCVFCSREHMTRGGVGYMPLQRFKQIVDQYGNLFRNIRLNVHGEPLKHPLLTEMISYLDTHASPRSIGIATNGTLLNLHLFRDLVDAGLTRLDVSYEGQNKQVYESTRRGANYEHMEKMLREIARYNYSRGNPTRIRVHTVATNENQQELAAFQNKWRSVNGIQQVTVGELSDWNGTVNITDLKPDSAVARGEWKVCGVPWFITQILWDGTVSPCPLWMGRERFGNIYEEPLEQIWNNPEYVGLRQQLINGENAGWCSKCTGCRFSPSDTPYLSDPSWCYPVSMNFLHQIAGVLKTRLHM